MVRDIPMKTVNHFELSPEVFFGEVVKHTSIHQTLHEMRSVLGQTQRWQPVLANPFMVHITKCQGLEEKNVREKMKFVNYETLLLIEV